MKSEENVSWLHSSATWSGDGDQPMPTPVRKGDNWYQCNVVVVNDMGVHARPASLIVGLSNKFKCDVTIHKDQEPVDGKSILQILSLSAEMGTPLLLETRGPDAEEAIKALSLLVASGFNERQSGPAEKS